MSSISGVSLQTYAQDLDQQAEESKYQESSKNRKIPSQMRNKSHKYHRGVNFSSSQ